VVSFFLKKTDADESFLKKCRGSGYNWTKPSFLKTSTDDREYLTKLSRRPAVNCPITKQKKNNRKNNCDSGNMSVTVKVTEKMIAEAVTNGADSPKRSSYNRRMKDPDCKVKTQKAPDVMRT
jgi:hypothetical protein